MDHILANVSKLLSSEAKLLIYSKVTQNLVDRPNTILWNEEPLSIDIETYNQLKDAIKKRGLKYYNRSSVMSYTDFCIALICCSDYSMNHFTIPSVSERGFTAAWRTLYIISNTSTDRVTNWINKYMLDRTSEAYSSRFESTQPLSVTSSSTNACNNSYSNVTGDKDIIDSLTFNETIVDIPYLDNSNDRIGLFRSSSMPESQLENLYLHWKINVRTDS